MSDLSEETVHVIGRMHRAHVSWTAIGLKFGISRFKARNAIYPEYAEVHNQTRKKARREKAKIAKPPKENIGRMASGEIITAPPPKEVLLERERRQSLVPHSITAWQFGDPLPGESAWDKRQKQTA